MRRVFFAAALTAVVLCVAALAAARGNLADVNSRGPGDRIAVVRSASHGAHPTVNQQQAAAPNARPATSARTKDVSASAWGSTACDLDGDGIVSPADVDAMTKMMLGLSPCTTQVCNIVVLQQLINAALGGTCATGTENARHTVTLTWSSSTSPNVAGYNIYKGTTAGGPYQRLNALLVVGTTYLDTEVQSGQTYYYVATAVDCSNTESAYSNEAYAMIPSP